MTPALTRSAAVDAAGQPVDRAIDTAAVAGLPVDQELGNLEGKELRFGTSAGATFSAVTTAVTCGSVNCMHDSLNPLAGLTPFTGMWLNCVFGGKGVGIINLLLYLIIGVFLAGLMVGRTPEYLGKKVEAREMKLAMLGLLIHPILVLGADRPVRRRRLGHQGDQQSWRPRLLGNPLRVLVGVGQQRLWLRGTRRHLGVQQAAGASRQGRQPLPRAPAP